MTLRELCNIGKQSLIKAKVPDAAYDARALLCFVLQKELTDYLAHMEEEADISATVYYLHLIDQRAGRVPMQQLTGCAWFMDDCFKVNKHVLIPRQDTEVLVQEALIRAGEMQRERLMVLDLCTGSGCIGISLYKRLENARICCSDVLPEALAVAAFNKEHLCGADADITLTESDLFEKIPERFDMIVSNPPYIRPDVIEELEPEVKYHEPLLALDGGADGLDFYRTISAEAGAHLTEGGWLLFEIGYDQGDAVSELMQSAGFKDVVCIKDLAGLDRVIAGRKD